MARRRLAWAVSLALSVIGWLGAHTAAYRIAAPTPDERTRLLEASGHEYLAYAPLVVAFCLIIAAVFLTAYAVGGRGARTRPSASVGVFGALPPLAFVVQEHVERLAHDGDVFAAAAEPVFLAGLLLQIPFALAALVVARLLLAFADAIVTRLGPGKPQRLLPGRALRTAPEVDAPRIAVLALGHGQRAPPPLIHVS